MMKAIASTNANTLRHAALGMVLACAATLVAQPQHRPGNSAPHVQQERPQPQQPQRGPSNSQGPVWSTGRNVRPNGSGNGITGQHFNQWMDQRRNLTPDQQRRALQNEPGFRQLPPETQQRLSQRLDKLNAMPPDQRQRMLQRNEMIERMSPQQRQQFRGAMQRWTMMDPSRRSTVARSFRELRSMPSDQRANALNSAEYRQRLTDDERTTLGTILMAEPAPQH